MTSQYSMKLAKAIDESGLKLIKIAERAGKICGSAPSVAYLSRVQNGKTSPASDSLNDALAEVLGIDPIELKIAAYREKLPADVLEKLQEAK